MKKIVLSIGLIASLSFAEGVINKDNILNQLKELQKEKAELSKDVNSPQQQQQAMRDKAEEKQKEINAQKIERLKKTVASFARSINDDIVVPKGKYSLVKLDNKESFFVFEDDVEELIYQKNTLHQKSDKIKLLQTQVSSLKPSDPAMDIQKISTDVDSLLHMNSSNMGMSVSNTTGTQMPLMELRAGDIYKEYRVVSKSGALVLSRYGEGK